MFVLGVDVGKSDLYARLLRVPPQGVPVPVGPVKAVPNTPAGYDALTGWLHACTALPGMTSVVMEATGVYWERLALVLHTTGFVVSVVNAAQIKFFAKSTLRRGKTDAMDAELIARYGAVMHPAPWMPPAADLEALRALLHERDAVVALITTEKGRHHAHDYRQQAHPLVVRLCEARLQLLEEQLDLLNEAIKRHTTNERRRSSDNTQQRKLDGDYFSNFIFKSHFTVYNPLYLDEFYGSLCAKKREILWRAARGALPQATTAAWVKQHISESRPFALSVLARAMPRDRGAQRLYHAAPL